MRYESRRRVACVGGVLRGVWTTTVSLVLAMACGHAPSARAAGACTAAQVQEFKATCDADGEGVHQLEVDCLRWDPSHYQCGYYPWPSKVRPKDSGLVCSILWIRSPAGTESPLPSRVADVRTLDCGCAVDEVWSAALQRCVPVIVPDGPPEPPPPSCPADSNPRGGKPIYPLSGTERFDLPLDMAVGGRPLVATYDTARRSPVTEIEYTLADNDKGGFGPLWTTNFQKRLLLSRAGRGARAMRGAGMSVAFVGNGSGVFTPSASTNDRLLGVTGGYRYIDASTQAQETYDSTGLLTRIDLASGGNLTYENSTGSTPAADAPGPGYLLSVTDSFGRSIRFQYDSAGRLTRVTDPAGVVVLFNNGGSENLLSVQWQDSRTRQFLYENAKFPWALTGIVAETGIRLATIAYDDDGRAISSGLAGGVNQYTVSYGQAPKVTVSDTYDANADVVQRTRSLQAPVAPQATLANGSVSDYGVTTVAGRPGVASKSQPAGAGCAASTQSQTFDANGNAASIDDFNGTRSCYAHDLSRNLQTVKVEGLSQAASCSSVLTANAALPANSRKTSTQWHPDWRLAVKVASPGRLTTNVYNGQPDPFNGNTPASCAPAGAVLPDGKPIAVLCKQVEQSTTDLDGHLGFSAALQASVANRVTRWTYNQVGQVLTVKRPRTDVNATTTFTYYTDTTADHTLGDLKSQTNAAGKTTSYTKYNAYGKVLESSDPNGVVTVNTYDSRQRLLTSSVGGEVTTYAYDYAGQLLQVTQPDGSWVGYEYDDAQRLTVVTDNLGNRIRYVLDTSGQSLGEEVKDPTGSLRRSQARVRDALGREQQLTGRE